MLAIGYDRNVMTAEVCFAWRSGDCDATSHEYREHWANQPCLRFVTPHEITDS
jgi:hypothetical protein